MTLIKTMFMGLYLELKTKKQRLSGPEEVVAALHTLGLHATGLKSLPFRFLTGCCMLVGRKKYPEVLSHTSA